MINRVAFTMYPVVDVEAARGFYETTLGLKPGLVGNHGDVHWIEYDLPGGGCLAITNVAGTPSSEAGGTIAFEVEDLDPLIEHLRGHGVTFRGDVVAGPNCRMITCFDPEGNSLVLHHRNR
jgi:predicted enzyme related to lactoylglutathione lyase